jgi:YVTN family beta-propeller protein
MNCPSPGFVAALSIYNRQDAIQWLDSPRSQCGKEDAIMKGLFALVVGSFITAISLPTFAGLPVSNVFVSNTGDQTFSLIRCLTNHGGKAIACRERQRMDVGFGTSWPANQYDGDPAWWWSGLSGEVVGIKAKASLSPLKNPENIVYVDTYNVPGRPDRGSNFIGISPDGRTAWNSAREVDRIQEIDTDPKSPTFGTVITELLVDDQDPDSGPTATLGAARPCDATLSPDGRYFFEPDLAGESMTVVDTQQKMVIWQVLPPRAKPDEKVLPFMATTNGKIVLIENLEGDNTYDVWDVSVLPDQPVHLKKITQDDGLGVDAQTSEFTRDGRYAYLIMRGVTDAPVGSPEASRIDVLGVDETVPDDYLTIVGSIDLPLNCRASTGDFSNDGRFFFVNCQNRNELVVVDSQTQQVVTSVAVGDSPRGVIVR